MASNKDAFEIAHDIFQKISMGGSLLGMVIDTASGEDPGSIHVASEPDGVLQTPLPGLVQRVFVDQRQKIVSIPIEGANGDVQLWRGLDAAKVYVDLRLCNDEQTGWQDALASAAALDIGGLASDIANAGGAAFSADDKLEILSGLFTAVKESQELIVWNLQNAHVNARLGPDARVIWVNLGSSDTSRNDIVEATLEFLQINPETVSAQEVGELVEDYIDSLDQATNPFGDQLPF